MPSPSALPQGAERALHFNESAARRLSLEAVLRCAPPRPPAAAESARIPCSAPAAPSPSALTVARSSCCCRGHHGCVNRLCWNEGGSLLASGSDDRKASKRLAVVLGALLMRSTVRLQSERARRSSLRAQVLLWSYPDSQRTPISVETEHQVRRA